MLAAPLPASEPVACFAVHARAEPGVMPRVLEFFAKRGLVPTACTSRVTGDELAIDLQMRGMEQDLAEYVAACLRQIVHVDVVLTSER
jgi:acetolactate synthase small subunit